MAEAFRTLSLPGALSQFKTISLQPLKIRVGNDVNAGARPFPSCKANRFSQKEETRDALDNFCNSSGAVVGRVGFELHDGRIYSPPARAGSNRSRNQFTD